MVTYIADKLQEVTIQLFYTITYQAADLIFNFKISLDVTEITKIQAKYLRFSPNVNIYVHYSEN